MFWFLANMNSTFLKSRPYVPLNQLLDIYEKNVE